MTTRQRRIMENIDGEERWYEVRLGRRVLTPGVELTLGTFDAPRLRFLHAIPMGGGWRLVCEDGAGVRQVVGPTLIGTVHHTRKLGAA
jgi:hypothetical protein